MRHFVLKEIDSCCMVPACKSGYTVHRRGMRWVQRWYPGRICTITTEVFAVTCKACLEAIQRDVAERLSGFPRVYYSWDGKAPEI
jgi:hypothetical protein